MPNWTEVLNEIRALKHESPTDKIRQKYLNELSNFTGRNVIAYYSGWLTANPNSPGLSIDDNDKNFFMSVINGLDRTKGLDLILHTPGGDITATESIVDYLREMFSTNIRAIIPQLAMSAGTMISCACSEIIMGKQSSLGPIDPQIGNIPAFGIIKEFEEAISEVKENPDKLKIWQIIISKYPPTFLGNCKRAIDMSKEMVKKWLETGMFKDDPDNVDKSDKITTYLSNLENNKTHSRHLSLAQCESIGLKIIKMESDQKMQDLVLTIHHTYMHTMQPNNIIKIVENQNNSRMVIFGR